MKVGIFTGNTGSIRSGMGNYIFNLLKNLKKNRDLDLTLIAHNEQTISPGLPTIIPYYPRSGFSIFFWCQFLYLQKKVFHRFDVIHNPAQYPILFKPSERYISTIHDITPIICPHYHPGWRSIYSRIAIPRLIVNSNKIITVSLQTKRDLISRYHVPEDKITVIYEGASEEYRKMDLSAVTEIREKYHLLFPFVLSVGNLEPRKNIPTLLKAFAISRRKIPGLKLVIVGQKGWNYADIFSTIEELQLQKEVIFLHYVPHEDLPAIYNAAELFVYPSFYEGFGLPPLEAMQCGIPVITSNTSSLPEIIGAGGIMVDPLDVHDLVDKMSLLLMDDQARRENIRYNLSRCTFFSWEKCAQQTAEVYEEVCNKPG
jgi:glycosyltransferase involved in cell wall biosynthesis